MFYVILMFGCRKMSTDVQWMIIRNTSSFLRKGKHATFTAVIITTFHIWINYAVFYQNAQVTVRIVLVSASTYVCVLIKQLLVMYRRSLLIWKTGTRSVLMVWSTRRPLALRPPLITRVSFLWRRTSVSDIRLLIFWNCNTLICMLIILNLLYAWIFWRADRNKPGKSLTKTTLKSSGRRTLATIRKTVRSQRYRKDLKMVSKLNHHDFWGYSKDGLHKYFASTVSCLA